MGDYRRLLAHLRPHLGLLALAIASMAALSLATGFFSWLVGPLFQFVFQGGALAPEAVRRAMPWLGAGAVHVDRDTLLRALPVLILAISLARGVAYFGQFYCMGMLGQRVVADLRLALQRKLLALPPAYFAQRSSGDLLARFTSDVAAVEFAVTYGIAAWLRDGLQVLVLLGVSVALDWRLALLAFVAVPLTVVPIVRFAKRLKRIAGRGQEQIGTLYTLLHEALSGVRIVQAFGMERYEHEKFSAEQERFLGTMKKSFFVRAIFTPTLELMAAVGIAATVIFAARAVAAGTLQPDRVISFLATIVLLYTPLKSLGGIGQGVTQGLAGARRLYEVLDEPDLLPEGDHELTGFSGEVRFDAVTFAYPARGDAARVSGTARDSGTPRGVPGSVAMDSGTRRGVPGSVAGIAGTPSSVPGSIAGTSSSVPGSIAGTPSSVPGTVPGTHGVPGTHASPVVLDGVELVLRRGEVVALVGPSGGGKTTLLQLVPRFADPTAGRVLLDGRDLRSLTLRSLRAQIALVSQETFLFNDTVRANIAYGLADVAQERLEAAARAALAHDFIVQLPQGYDTPVGERGVTLSGGQRQRLAIARALLKDAPILLLDEATSALDTESEREVQRALDRLMQDRTCLVIAHRLSTIRHAHRIAVLAAGRIVELGTHDELLARRGEYARLYALQFAPLERETA